MKQFAFILGREAQVSIAELKNTLDGEILYADGNYLLAEGALPHPQDFLNRLGGTQKIFEIIGEYKTPEEAAEGAEDFLKDRLEGQSGKSHWGLNLCGLAQKEMKKWLMQIKKALKSESISARFVNKDFKNLSSAASIKEGLIHGDGSELAILRYREAYLLGEAVAVQDIDKYSERDYGRPARSAKAGMFPPKLAQILLNLANLKSGQKVYDPFCGSGTVLTEALLQKYSVIGSDIDFEQVQDCQTNCAWIAEKYNIKNKSQIFQHDGTKPFPEGLNFDAIVTEGYLGKPISRPLKPHEVTPHIREIEKIYREFFVQIKKHIKSKQRIVITLPFLRGERGDIFLRGTLLEHIRNNGFAFHKPENKKNNPRPSLLYRRENQTVGREILILERD